MEEPSDGLHEIQKLEEDRAEDRHLWRLGVDGLILAVQILYIFNIYRLIGLSVTK